MIDQIDPLAKKLSSFMNKKLGFKKPPRLFLKNDENNSKQVFGKTAFYDPGQSSVTIFIAGRHPKDILRSLAHELVHHHQNERGDFSSDKCGDDVSDTYAQDNKHLRNMEKEAYLVGNMCFRDWEDSCKFNLSESKFLKENKKMSATLNKRTLTKMIKSILKEDNRAPIGPLIKRAINLVMIWDPAARKKEARVIAKEAAVALRQAGVLSRSGPPHPTTAGFQDLTSAGAILRDSIKLVARGKTMLLYGFNPSDKDPKHKRSTVAPDIVEDLLRKGSISLDQVMGGEEFRENPTHSWVGDQKTLAHYKKSSAGEVVAQLKSLTSMVAPDDTPRKPVTPPPLEEGEAGDCGCTDLDGTPEREENLYTERFEQRDTSLYNRLLKEWTK